MQRILVQLVANPTVRVQEAPQPRGMAATQVPHTSPILSPAARRASGSPAGVARREPFAGIPARALASNVEGLR